MRLITVTYLGKAAMNRRFSAPMIPWVVMEIKRANFSQKVSLGVENGILQAYNIDFELKFEHRVENMTLFKEADTKSKTFLYFLKDDFNDQVLHCYLFLANKVSDVTDLHILMRQQQSHAVKTAPNLLKLETACISMNSSNFFEVLYVGKIQISHSKVPDTFIDDAIVKIGSSTNESSNNQFNQLLINHSNNDLKQDVISNSQSLHKLNSSHSENQGRSLQLAKSQSVQNIDNLTNNKLLSKLSPAEDNNRTMVLQIGQVDLRLISLDRKSVLLRKFHKDVISCVQGIQNSEYFGFACRESNASTSFVAYILKCESDSVTSEVVNALSQAYANHESVQNMSSCEHCPMVWYHRLCTDIESLNDRRTLANILKRVEALETPEQDQIMSKFRSTDISSVSGQNEYLMLLLRAHCEAKQAHHMHDSLENRSEFLNHYLGGGNTIFMKAKRSLSNSFDVLLKRKGSRDDGGSMTVTSPKTKDLSLPLHQNYGKNHDEKLKSPMMDIFLKVGSNTKTVPVNEDELHKLEAPDSWRQTIFKSVQKRTESDLISAREKSMSSRSPDKYRKLWQQSIDRVITLIRIEKDNARIRVKQKETALKRIKLEYDNLNDKTNLNVQLTEILTASNIDMELLSKAIRCGISKTDRGDLWTYLSHRYESGNESFRHADSKMNFPNYQQSYDSLSKQLTAHQHAILIDLGRTFPNHSYFSGAFGPGQLSLFNLLKAYSLLDPEVGYCQGLSFIAGVLLLHVDECKAFGLMEHVMFRREIRKQFLPDMEELQIQLYQLTRLLHDRLPNLRALFDRYDVSASLYAAPWMLTIFASQFPLGFVTRVFDLIFLDGRNVIFKVSLALLDHHKEQLLQCHNFEEVMNYLKETLPSSIDEKSLSLIMDNVFKIDIGKELDEYRVEYCVLQEEMASVRPIIEAFKRVEKQNDSLLKKNNILSTQLEMALSNSQRLEKSLAIQQSAQNRLDMDSRALEISVNILAGFINAILDKKLIDYTVLPDEVRRIVTQLASQTEKPRSSSSHNQHNLMKSLSLNKIATNNATQRRNSLITDSDADVKIDKLTKILARSPQPMTSSPIRVIDDDMVYVPVDRNQNRFFSNSHNSILQQQLNGASGSSSTVKDHIPMPKSVSLPINTSRTSAIIVEEDNNDSDSGISTPQTADATSPNSSIASVTHPLSGSDVNITYTGTTQLKKLTNSPSSHQLSQRGHQ